jgi:glycosidase
MKNLKRRFASFVIAAACAFTFVAPQPGLYAQTTYAATPASSTHATDAEAKANNLAVNTVDGTILHAWCWSFKTIKANMKDIAAAGFSTVQTSPANACVSAYPTMKLMGSDQTNGTDGCWWWQYQPTDWTIGNYQLGSEQDFKDMCAEADKYGIKIIVDVIPNHTTPRLNEVSQNLINAAGGGKGVAGGLYHKNGFKNITQWGNRYECTTGQMGGLPDVNTENPNFQDYFVKYLDELVKDGCDGMRYDTAKHIGVPSDPKDEYTSQNGWTNNFWPLVTGKEANKNGTKFNASDLFIYGEVLQGDNVPQDEYQKYLSMTASNYGGTIRGAITSNNFSAWNLKNMQVSDTSKAVTWVESHDTYCNNHESARLTDKQIELGWAILAAQKNGTPLFFSRPDGSNGSQGNYWGNNVLGAKGNDEFKSTIVKCANFFRNAMVGQGQNISNPTGNNSLVMIERGSKGVALVNGGSSTSINVSTKLSDGTYTDTVSRRTFTVKNGKLSGSIDGSTAAFIYKTSSSTGSSTGSNTGSSTGSSGSQSTGSTSDADLSSVIDGSYNIYFVNSDNWSGDIKAYLYDSDNTSSNNSQWPGASMTKVGTVGGKDVYGYNVPSNLSGKNLKVIFTNGSEQFPTHQGDKDGLDYSSGSYQLTSNNASSWTAVKKNSSTGSSGTGSSTSASTVIDGSYNIYFVNSNNWSGDIKAYMYDSDNTSNNNGQWPGAAMTKVGTENGKDVYAINVPSNLTGKSVKVIFTNGSEQFPTHQGDKDGLDYTSGSYQLTSIDASSWTAVEKRTSTGGSGTGSSGSGTSDTGVTDTDDDSDIFDIDYEDIEDGDYTAEDGDELTTENAVYTVTSAGDEKTVEYSECFVENPKKIVVPDTVTIDGTTYQVTSIGSGAFARQTTMTAVAIGKNVKTIGTRVFYGCTKLKQVVVNSTVLSTIKSGAFRKVNSSVMVLVPKAKASAYKKLFKKAGIASKNIKAISATQKKKNSTSTDTGTSKDTGSSSGSSGSSSSSTGSTSGSSGSSSSSTGSTSGSTGSSGSSGSSSSSGSTTSVVTTKLYSTNVNGFGSKKTITSPTDFTDADIIAQGAANDDPRTFRGPHEGPVYDDYALYAAYDDENLYVGWQYVNVADVSASDQDYPNSDNGFPDNGDIPQMLAFYVPGQKVSSGNLSGNAGKVWGLDVDFTTPITALACFSSKNTNGTPALFTTGKDGNFNYDDNCIGFKKAGITYKCYRGVSLSSYIYGINGNGYTGLTPDQFLNGTGNVVDFNTLGHDTAKDSFYLMTIPLKAIGTSASQIASKGLGLMHISTFGASGIGCLPTDPSMYDNAMAAYSSDESTSAEKEDVDNITVPLAYVGKKAS